MGCSQSKIDIEEALARCKIRKHHIREAVSARNAFALAHSAYALSLKNTGSAITDYSPGESNNFQNTSTVANSSQPERETILPPPPPLLKLPVLRATAMPEFVKPEKHIKNEEPEIQEEHEEREEDEGSLKRRRRRIPENSVIENESNSKWDLLFPANIPGPSIAETIEYKITKGSMKPEIFNEITEKKEEKHVDKKEHTIVKKGKDVLKTGVVVNLVKVFRELDDQFMMAFVSARDISRMLEANRLHYHSNFADEGGHIDHSDRVMRAITWSKSFRGQLDNDDKKYDFNSEEHETHATVLDKLMAWEKKLYDEVKAGELMKIEYQKKLVLLNKQKKNNMNHEALENAKAAVSHLHTRYTVDMQSLDSTIQEINHIRDNQLYPKLVELVDGLATMWETMRDHHLQQLEISDSLKHVDISQFPKQISQNHHERTVQLWIVIQNWHNEFETLTTHQKTYIKSINNWLKLNLERTNLTDTGSKGSVASQKSPKCPPIQNLLQTWHDSLEKIPYEEARLSIASFSAVIQTIVQHQEEEMVLKERYEVTQKELSRRTRIFDEWRRRYMEKHGPSDERDQEDPVVERRGVVNALKKRFDDDFGAYEKQCVHARNKAFVSLTTRLPDLFEKMSNYAHACSKMYGDLISGLKSS